MRNRGHEVRLCAPPPSLSPSTVPIRPANTSAARPPPINPGEAVVTGAHELPNRHVIHCLGPRYGIDEPSDELLARCYRRALRLAEEYEIGSIAFPALSTGAFGYPMEEAARIAFETVLGELPKLTTVTLIRFVLFSEHDTDLHARILEETAS